MKNLVSLILCCWLMVGLVSAQSDCYIITEDALIADSPQTWEMANFLLMNQDMEKLTKLSLEEKISVIKKGQKVTVFSSGPTLNEIMTEKDKKKWFIAIEVTRPCSKTNQ